MIKPQLKDTVTPLRTGFSWSRSPLQRGFALLLLPSEAFHQKEIITMHLVALTPRPLATWIWTITCARLDSKGASIPRPQTPSKVERASRIEVDGEEEEVFLQERSILPTYIYT